MHDTIYDNLNGNRIKFITECLFAKKLIQILFKYISLLIISDIVGGGAVLLQVSNIIITALVGLFFPGCQ